ncbi:MAG: IPTL-CTERM sorting domain-containing protein [Acidobacteriota bacterium]
MSFLARTVALLALAGLFGTSVPASARPCVPVGSEVDQSFLPASTIGNSTGGFAGLLIYGQTFTPGADGLLLSVSLTLRSFGPANTSSNLQVDIRTAPGGLPGTDPGDVLATTFVTPGMVTPGFQDILVTIDFSDQDVVVTTGEQLAIVLTPVDLGSRYDMPGAVDYPGGAVYTWLDGDPPTPPIPAHDLLFETVVGPCAAPIPALSEWALIGLAVVLGMTGMVLLRRQA